VLCTTTWRFLLSVVYDHAEVSVECCLLSRGGFCDGPISCIEEPYRMFVCVCVRACE